ncbi:MAG: molybdenum cofactor guanylyltransferase [Planctomycetaceae bacterium]
MTSPHSHSVVISSSLGGIVLCGGASRRMGQPKLSLPFGSEFSLQRVVRQLGAIVSRVIVVAAPDQDVPLLPSNVTLHRDNVANCGPMAGLVVGLETLAESHEAAFVTSCDAPFLVPDFVQQLWLQMLGSTRDDIDTSPGIPITYDIAVPQEGDFFHPLAAIYRTQLASVVRERLATNSYSLQGLIKESSVCAVPIEKLRLVDPDLLTLRNINTYEDYLSALQVAKALDEV